MNNEENTNETVQLFIIKECPNEVLYTLQINKTL